MTRPAMTRDPTTTGSGCSSDDSEFIPSFTGCRHQEQARQELHVPSPSIRSAVDILLDVSARRYEPPPDPLGPLNDPQRHPTPRRIRLPLVEVTCRDRVPITTLPDAATLSAVIGVMQLHVVITAVISAGIDVDVNAPVDPEVLVRTELDREVALPSRRLPNPTDRRTDIGVKSNRVPVVRIEPHISIAER